MRPKQMFTVTADKARQLLTIAFSQHVTAAEAKACVEQVQKALESMEVGFRLLTDLAGLESMETASSSSIIRSMELCAAKGVRFVVRVIPDPQKDIGFNLMSRFHYGRDVRIVTCETMDDATSQLAG